MKNCPNCGAPIQNEICDYCGTVMYDFSCIDISSPCYVRVKHNGKVLQAKMYVGDISVIPHTTEILARNLSGNLISHTDKQVQLYMKLISVNGYDVVDG